jgi:hypothetical protein
MGMLALTLSTITAVSVPNPKYDFVKRVSMVLACGLTVCLPVGLLLLRRRPGFMRGLEQIPADLLVLAPLVFFVTFAEAGDMGKSWVFVCMSLGMYAVVSSLPTADAEVSTPLFGVGSRQGRNWRRRLAFSLVIAALLPAFGAWLLRTTWAPTHGFASLWGGGIAVFGCAILPGIWGYWLFEAAIADDVDIASPTEHAACANPRAKRRRLLRVAGLSSIVLGVSSPIVAVVLTGEVRRGLFVSAVGALLFAASLPLALARARTKLPR